MWESECVIRLMWGWMVSGAESRVVREWLPSDNCVKIRTVLPITFHHHHHIKYTRLQPTHPSTRPTDAAATPQNHKSDNYSNVINSFVCRLWQINLMIFHLLLPFGWWLVRNRFCPNDPSVDDRRHLVIESMWFRIKNWWSTTETNRGFGGGGEGVG